MQAAQVAANVVRDDCPTVVIDSRTVSMGLGALCLTAARRAADGGRLEEIVEDVISRRDRTRLFGALDTLEFLKRGGRIGNARALLGSMLSIKPIVEVRDGVVEESGKVRTRSKALAALADRVEGPADRHVRGAARPGDRRRRVARPPRSGVPPRRDRHRTRRSR